MNIRPLAAADLAVEVSRLRPGKERSEEVARTVAEIVAQIQSGGDATLAELTARFDWPQASAGAVRVPETDIDAAVTGLDSELRHALLVARENCVWFHQHERRRDWCEEGPFGQVLGIRYLPVERAGLYVPGGLGSYASTVIMNTVPAQVAGVRELFICTPPGRDGRVNESVLAAAGLMGVREVYRVGGAQAVAAMAYGTESIRRADVICGPGNAYVMEAKRQVFGQVGIDGLAGPSEVVVVADEEARPEWVAADLLAQEEHGSGAQAVLFAWSEGFCARVEMAVAALRAELDSAGAAPSVSSETLGAAGAEDSLCAFYPGVGEDPAALAAALVNAYAPEHLELHLSAPRAFAERISSAGAIFLGQRTPTAFGDYVAGSNHVLPTGGSARFAGPLSVDTFLRASSLVELTGGAVRGLAPHLSRLARSEGFGFHQLSAELRAREG